MAGVDAEYVKGIGNLRQDGLSLCLRHFDACGVCAMLTEAFTYPHMNAALRLSVDRQLRRCEVIMAVNDTDKIAGSQSLHLSDRSLPVAGE